MVADQLVGVDQGFVPGERGRPSLSRNCPTIALAIQWMTPWMELARAAPAAPLAFCLVPQQTSQPARCYPTHHHPIPTMATMPAKTRRRIRASSLIITNAPAPRVRQPSDDWSDSAVSNPRQADPRHCRAKLRSQRCRPRSPAPCPQYRRMPRETAFLLLRARWQNVPTGAYECEGKTARLL